MSTSKRSLRAVPVDGRTTVFLNKAGAPVYLETDSTSRDPVEDAAQYLGHLLESKDDAWVRIPSGGWRVPVWFHEDCDCSGCVARRGKGAHP